MVGFGTVFVWWEWGGFRVAFVCPVICLCSVCCEDTPVIRSRSLILGGFVFGSVCSGFSSGCGVTKWKLLTNANIPQPSVQCDDTHSRNYKNIIPFLVVEDPIMKPPNSTLSGDSFKFHKTYNPPISHLPNELSKSRYELFLDATLG